MPIEERTRFIFTSSALADDTFTLVEFTGLEAISKLYKFEIILDAEDPEIDLKEVLKNPVTLTIERDGEAQRTFHGILSRFEQLHEYSEHIYYRAVLVPRLWIADQHHENQLFLDKKLPEIIEEILKQTGLTSQDYELRLTGNYQPWEYICQYNETDFNFISRWMEREGIYYYFDQNDDGEKIIITDHSTAHADIPGEVSIRYSPPDSLVPTTRDQVREFTCRQQMLPQKVVLKDYNYRKPSLDLKGEADVDSEGRGNVYIYGEHFKTPEEGNALATIRAEELQCKEMVFHGEGTVPPFLSGYIFELNDHYRDSYNQRYLITELSHQGVQANYLTSSMEVAPEDITPSYFNRFTVIPADIQFRPERVSVKPKFYGTLNAKVDAGGDGQYAEIDDEGRYKISLPFDQSGNQDGKASRWIRMSQPYAGADYGMHFPLHKGTEVLLTFIDGDPDRPIISGSVPNPETMSPITGENQTKCMIRTGGGNQIHTEDQDGNQLLKLYSPTANSSIRIGAPNPSGESGIAIDTEDNMWMVVEGWQDARIGQWRQFHVEGQEDKYVDQDRNLYVGGKEKIENSQTRKKTVTGKEKSFLNGGQDTYVRGGRIMQVSTGGDTTTIYDGQNHTVHGNRRLTVNGANTTVSNSETYTVNGTRTITVNGAQTRTIDSETSIHKVAQNEIKTGNYISCYSGAYADNKLAAAFENYIGIKLELKASVGIEIAAIKLGFTTLNIAQDMVVMKEGKLVAGDKVYLSQRVIDMIG